MKNNSNNSSEYLILYFIFWIICTISWVLNIYKLITTIDSATVSMIIVRIVGIPFRPIGVVMGII